MCFECGSLCTKVLDGLILQYNSSRRGHAILHTNIELIPRLHVAPNADIKSNPPMHFSEPNANDQGDRISRCTHESTRRLFSRSS